MNHLFFTGRLGSDAENRQAGSDNVTSFSVAADSGFGERKTTIWYRCSVWGKRGSAIAQHLTKGTKVTVSGEFSQREYNGKIQNEVRVIEIDFSSNQRQDNPALGNGGGRKADPFDAGDLDDHVPFIFMGHSDDNARRMVM